METDYKQLCWRLLNQYVGVKTSDGHTYDGFIAHVDDDHVTLAVPSDEMIEGMHGMRAHESTYRQFGFFPGFFPRRRFFFHRIPFSLFNALFLLPFFI